MAKPVLKGNKILAKDLRIGDRLGTSKNGDAVTVKVLNELCHVLPSPHVHAVTTEAAHCFPFTKVV